SFAPACKQFAVASALPHSQARDGMESELAVRVSGRDLVGTTLQRFLHRGAERLAVQLEGVGTSHLTPEGGLFDLLRLEVERSMEQGEAVIDLEAADRELSRAAEPSKCARAQLGQLALVAGPRQIGVLLANRLRVVVGE